MTNLDRNEIAVKTESDPVRVAIIAAGVARTYLEIATEELGHHGMTAEQQCRLAEILAGLTAEIFVLTHRLTYCETVESSDSSARSRMLCKPAREGSVDSALETAQRAAQGPRGVSLSDYDGEE